MVVDCLIKVLRVPDDIARASSGPIKRERDACLAESTVSLPKFPLRPLTQLSTKSLSIAVASGAL